MPTLLLRHVPEHLLIDKAAASEKILAPIVQRLLAVPPDAARLPR